MLFRSTFGGDVLCVWERYTLHSACAWEREMPGDLESGEDMCACLRDKVIRDLYWGPDFRREGGVNVLVCSCLGERTTSVCGGGRGGGVGLR